MLFSTYHLAHNNDGLFSRLPPFVTDLLKLQNEFLLRNTSSQVAKLTEKDLCQLSTHMKRKILEVIGSIEGDIQRQPELMKTAKEGYDYLKKYIYPCFRKWGFPDNILILSPMLTSTFLSQLLFENIIFYREISRFILLEVSSFSNIHLYKDVLISLFQSQNKHLNKHKTHNKFLLEMYIGLMIMVIRGDITWIMSVFF